MPGRVFGYNSYLVHSVLRARVLHLDHNERVKELGANEVWAKWGVALLEHNGHNVIANVTLPGNLHSQICSKCLIVTKPNFDHTHFTCCWSQGS